MIARIRVPALVIALALGAGVGAVTSTTCPDPVASGTDAQWRALVAVGWHGDPTDSMEALYAPDC